MRRIRFSIGGLLVLVLFAGVAIGALKEATDVWDSGVFSLTVALLLISVLLCVQRRERKRAFWLGFAVFGGAYLLVSLVPALEPRLATTRALSCLYANRPWAAEPGLAYFDYDNDGMLDLVEAQGQNNALVFLNLGDGTFRRLNTNSDKLIDRSQTTGQVQLWRRFAQSRLWSTGGGTFENFQRIGHSLFALIAAFLGGQLSCVFHNQRAGGKA
jgi:hypothetical protein